MPVSRAAVIIACRCGGGGWQQQLLLGNAEHRAPGAPLAGHLEPSERIDPQQLLVNSPVQDMAQDA
jgi:hypothetical protein